MSTGKAAGCPWYFYPGQPVFFYNLRSNFLPQEGYLWACWPLFENIIYNFSIAHRDRRFKLFYNSLKRESPRFEPWADINV